MKRWRYTPAADLDLHMTQRLRSFPREPDMLIYGLRAVVSLAIRGALRVYNRLEVSGAEHLPLDRSFVLVANHCSHLDTVCLLAALPFRKVHRAFPAAAADYFFRSVARTWIAAVVTNALPFGRNGSIRHTMAACEQLLASNGNVLIVFPEGTRSRDGELHEFKPGIGALVAGRDVPVLPCFIDGSFRGWPKGQRLPLPRKVRLTIGTARNFAARSNDKPSIAAIASELHTAVKQLATTHDFRRTHDTELGRPRAVLPLVDSARVDG